MAAIEAEGLVKVYRSRKTKVRALDGVDLEVKEGTVLGLLGPNGAGKTTTVRILTTLLRPDAGTARVAGLDVVRDAQAVRRSIGLSGQYATIDENLTGRENLWMFGRLYQLSSAEARIRADELLERFLLGEAADRVAMTYSGGMRRRLDLASALIGRPRLLFLDEPTTGLDPRSRLGMWDVIRAQVREGGTLLLTTQYLEEAAELPNEIAVVDKGEIIARGTADELKSQVGSERIEVVVHELANLARAAQLIAPDGGAAQLVEVGRQLGEAVIKIDDIALRRPTLHDVSSRSSGALPRSGRARKRHKGRGRRRPDHDLAQPEAGAADPRARDLRDPPVDHVRAAVRLRLRRRDPAPGYQGDHPFLLSILWTVALLAVFAPLAVRKYRSIDR